VCVAVGVLRRFIVVQTSKTLILGDLETEKMSEVK